MEKLSMVALKRCSYMGVSLYNLRGTSGFDGRTGFDLNTSRVFPQGALTAITLLGDGSELKGLGPEPGVSQCFFLFAQWPSQSFWEYSGSQVPEAPEESSAGARALVCLFGKSQCIVYGGLATLRHVVSLWCAAYANSSNGCPLPAQAWSYL